MITLLLGMFALAQDAPDIGMDDDLMGFLQQQKAQWPDRTRPPTVADPEVWELPEWTEHQLGQVRVLHVPVEGVRKVQLVLYREKGALHLDGEATETSWATGWMADAATASHDALSLEMALDAVDGELSTDGVDLVQQRLQIAAPVEDFPKALALFAEVLTEPAYPKKDLKRYAREQKLDLSLLAATRPSTVAGRTLRFAWHPAESPYGRRPRLSEYKLDPAQLVERNLRLNAEAPLTAVVAGDVEWSTLEPLLSAAFEGLGSDAQPDTYPAATPPSESRRVAVHIPGAKQTVVRLRMAAPPEGHDDELAIDLVNWAYGGAFLSRLNRSLREEHGWTYGSWSRYRRHPGLGTVDVGYDTATETVSESITETARILGTLAQDGPTDDELQGAWKERVGAWNTTLVDGQTAGSAYARFYDAGLTPSSARDQVVAMGEVTPEQATQAAQRWLHADKPQLWVVVGDRTLLEPELKELGWDWEWLEAPDAVLGSFE